MGLYENVTIAAGLSSLASWDTYIQTGKKEDIEVSAICYTALLIDLDQRELVFDAIEREETPFGIEHWAGENNLNNRGAIYKDPIVKEFMRSRRRPPKKEYDLSTIFTERTLNSTSVLSVEAIVRGCQDISSISRNSVKVTFPGKIEIDTRGGIYEYETANWRVERVNFIREMLRDQLVRDRSVIEDYHIDKKEKLITVDGTVISFDWVHQYVILKEIMDFQTDSHVSKHDSVRRLIELVKKISTVNKGRLPIANAVDFIMDTLFDHTKYKKFLHSIHFSTPTVGLGEEKIRITQWCVGIEASAVIGGSDEIIIESIAGLYLTKELEKVRAKSFTDAGDRDEWLEELRLTPRIKTTLQELAGKIIVDTDYVPVYIDFGYDHSSLYLREKKQYSIDEYERIMGYVPQEGRVMFPYMDFERKEKENE